MPADVALTPIDYVVAILILLVPVAIGLYYAVKDAHKSSRDGHVLGGRQMPVVPVMLSLFITFQWKLHILTLQLGCGGVVSASDSRSGGRRFDSRPCHVAIALEKQFTLTFSTPPTCKMGTYLQASNVLVCWGISGAALRRHSYAE
ncbi:sodium-coupled monocarboxylate transporter 1 [Elysia marginata]|uniref:Sodium-coupled monocarboxylate transporter 1 n=1 Tax=Elysia marginata TaxID=1093978 RepID=A0AAV4FK68_9GAST|nr:sodium-coupled monocarboxylate transporter 1 [Elysia marginata]